MPITGTLQGLPNWWKVGNSGPWLMPNGALYAITSKSDASGAAGHILKSTDNGATWTSVASHTGEELSADVVGSIIHIAWWTDGSAAGEYRRFDTSTDTLGAIIGTFPAKASAAVANIWGMSLAARSTGDVAIIYSGAPHTSMGTSYGRVRMATYIGTTWTTEVVVDTGGTTTVSFAPYAIVRGASDRIHLLYTSWDGTTRALRHRALPTTNTLAAEQSVVTILNAAYPVGRAASDGTSVAIPYVGTTGALLEARASSADAPAWTTGTAISDTGNAPETANANPGVIAFGGSAWNARWINDAQTAILRDVRTATAYGTDATEISVTGPINAISGNWVGIGNGGVGIIYDNNGVVTYQGPDAGSTTIQGAGASIGTSVTAAAASLLVSASGASIGTSATAGDATAGTFLSGAGASIGTSETAAASSTLQVRSTGASSGTATTAAASSLRSTATATSLGTSTTLAAARLLTTTSGASVGESTTAAAPRIIITSTGSSVGTSATAAEGFTGAAPLMGSGASIGESATAADARLVAISGGAATGESITTGTARLVMAGAGSSVGSSVTFGAADVVGGVVLLDPSIFANGGDIASVFAGPAFVIGIPGGDTQSIISGPDRDLVFSGGDTT